jgi:NADH-quinone oxidoreductase subunit G
MADNRERETAVILENDLYRRAEAERVDGFLRSFRRVVVIDHLLTPTARKAHLVLPAATFAEADGTFVNNEGRAQRIFPVFPDTGQVRPSWRWVSEIMRAAGRREAEGWRSFDDVTASMALAIPALEGVQRAAPRRDFREAGMKVAREHPRASGRTAVHADRGIHEEPPPVDTDAPFTFSMEGYAGQPPPALIPRFWAPGWNSVQSVNKFQAEVSGPLCGGDPGVRLVEPGGGEGRYFDEAPKNLALPEGALIVVASHHVFGSEELSMHAPGIRELAPRASCALSPEEMARLGLADGDAVLLSMDGRSRRLPARSDDKLPAGVAAVPCGLPDAPVLILPAMARVEKAVP